MILFLAGHASGDAKRDELLGYIARDPGIHKSELCRQANLSWGTISHHLRRLERDGYVRTVPHGRRVLVYPGGTDPKHVAWVAMLSEKPVGEILNVLRDRPAGIQDVRSKTGLSRKVIRRHLYGLRDAGLIKADAAYHPKYSLDDSMRHVVGSLMGYGSITESLGSSTPGKGLAGPKYRVPKKD